MIKNNLGDFSATVEMTKEMVEMTKKEIRNDNN